MKDADKQINRNTNMLSQTDRAKIRQQTDEIHRSLVVDSDKGSLPESIFKNYFLPYLSGLVDIPRDLDVISEWISIAGNPVAEVNILGDGSGKVLFTVPSLFNTDNVNTVNKTDVGFKEIFTSFEMRMNNIPSAANKYLAYNLENKLSIVESKKNTRDPLRWKEILKRYDIKTVESDTAVTVSADVADDLEYE